MIINSLRCISLVDRYHLVWINELNDLVLANFENIELYRSFNATQENGSCK